VPAKSNLAFTFKVNAKMEMFQIQVPPCFLILYLVPNLADKARPLACAQHKLVPQFLGFLIS